MSDRSSIEILSTQILSTETVQADMQGKLRRQVAQRWWQLTQELDDMERRVGELEAVMQCCGIDPTYYSPSPTRH